MNPLSVVAVLTFGITLVLAWRRKWPMLQALVVANLLVFVLTILTSDDKVTLRGSDLVDDLALRPSYLVDPQPLRAYTILTSSFLHADLAHVVGNMLVLLMIGLAFEERVGRTRLLLIYGGSAVVAVVLHSLWMVGTESAGALDVPVVGASGAVFGILGAFAATYPRDRVPMIFIFLIQRVPVIFAALFLTLVEGAFLFTGEAIGGVARAAHIGGAVGGVLLGLLLKPRGRPDADRPSRIDYGSLDRLAVEPKQKALVERLRMNEGHPELQRPWLEKIAASFTCPQCGQTYGGVHRGHLVCANGHKERYAQ